MQTEFGRRGMREAFLLAPEQVYLNAGTFSATPRVVFEEQTRLRAEAESNPTRIAAWCGRDPFWKAQAGIAAYIGAEPHDIIMHQNITQAMNQAFFCLEWPKGSELLVSDMEYGAVVNAAREAARRRNVALRTFKLPTHPQSEDDIYSSVIDSLTPETSGVLLSHVVSGNGLVSPVERIAAELRSRGIMFFVDGAHAPGLIPLELSKTQIDIYGGNLHKWFMGPKGTAFLYVARRLHGKMQPHIVGWGDTPQGKPIREFHEYGQNYPFQHIFRLQGMLDFSPFLALPATLRFRGDIGEERIRARIGQLCAYLRERMGEIAEAEPASPPPHLNAGLIAYTFPLREPAIGWQEELFERWKITVATNVAPQPRVWMRISPHIWIGEDDIDRLIDALKTLVREKGLSGASRASRAECARA